MNKHFEELANLVGKLLAKRWLNSRATRSNQTVVSANKRAQDIKSGRSASGAVKTKPNL